MIRTFALLSLLMLQTSSCLGAITLEGDSTTSGETFTFPVHQAQMNNNLFYVAANQAVADNEFAIAVAGEGNKKFIKLAPKQIKLNNATNQNNPLTGAKISNMSLFGTSPIVVADGIKKVFILDNVSQGAMPSVFETVELKGPNSVVVDSILKTAGGNSYFIAAVTGGGILGDVGSGIALVSVTAKDEPTEVDGQTRNVIKKSLDVLDAATGAAGGNKALPFNGSTPAIKVGADATINSNIIDIHWSQEIERFYISLDLTSGPGATDKVRAVAIGRLTLNAGKPIIALDAIVPDGAITGTDQMVAAEGHVQTVAISHVRTMLTSTRLNYLIAAGGNGVSGNTVYAMPLVNQRREGGTLHANTNQGTLAKADQAPKNYFTKDSGLFESGNVGRAFVTPATTPADLLTDSSAVAQVGGGALPISATDSIDNIFVIKDAVYVAVSNDTGINEPGLWQSQAILDDEGKIASWTSWQKVVGTTGKVFGAGQNLNTGTYTYLAGDGAGDPKVVNRTQWSKGSFLGSLTSLVSDALPQAQGGVQGFSIFKSTGLTGNFNFLSATGLNRVLLAQTRNAAGSVVGDFATNSVASTDGTMPAASAATRFVSISGGTLQDLGPITTSTIAQNITDNWLVVGGTNGLAILADGAGAGWAGSITDFTGMAGAFKKLGNFSFVRKVVSDHNFLYVLTEDKLYRAALTNAGVANDTVSFVVIADAKGVNHTAGTAFFDLLVSGDLALLATSIGLYRTGDGASILTASDANDVGWTMVDVPDAATPIFKLIPVSPNLEESGFSEKGQVYVLSSFIGYHQTKLNRLFVDLAGPVSGTTIKAVPDQFFKGSTSYLVNFGEFRSGFFTNGGLLMSSRSADVAGDIALNILPERLRSGTVFAETDETKAPIKLDGFNQFGNISIVPYLGSIIFSGDFGLRVNE